DVDRTPDPLRGDRAHDLLERDEVLTATPDERAELTAAHVESVLARLLAVRDLRLDAHPREQVAEDRRALREILGERGRPFVLVAFLQRARYRHRRCHRRCRSRRCALRRARDPRGPRARSPRSRASSPCPPASRPRAGTAGTSGAVPTRSRSTAARSGTAS